VVSRPRNFLRGDGMVGIFGGNMQHWLLLAGAIVCEVVGTSALKAAEGFTRFWPSVIVAVGYVAAFFLLSQTLKVIPVGVAYAIWSGAGVALIGVIGWLFLGQPLDVPAIIGMGLIVAGVVVINVFSTATPH